MGDQDALAGRGEVRDGFAGVFVVGDRAYRHEQSHVVAGMAGAIRAFAVAAAVGFEFAVVAIAQQRVVVWIGFKVDAAAGAAIAAGRSAARNIFFATERNTTVAAVAGFYIDFGFINEHLQESYQETCAADFKLRSFAYPHRICRDDDALSFNDRSKKKTARNDRAANCQCQQFQK